MMWTATFWRDAAERAIKTGCQFALPVWVAVTFTAVGEVLPTATATGLAFLSGAVMSLLTSLASEPFGPKGSPSLVKAGE